MVQNLVTKFRQNYFQAMVYLKSLAFLNSNNYFKKLAKYTKL